MVTLPLLSCFYRNMNILQYIASIVSSIEIWLRYTYPGFKRVTMPTVKNRLIIYWLWLVLITLLDLWLLTPFHSTLSVAKDQEGWDGHDWASLRGYTIKVKMHWALLFTLCLNDTHWNGKSLHEHEIKHSTWITTISCLSKTETIGYLRVWTILIG